MDIIEESGLAKGVALQVMCSSHIFLHLLTHFVFQVTTKGVLAGFQHAFVRNASATPFVSRLGLGVYAEIFTHNEVRRPYSIPSNRFATGICFDTSQVSMETLMTLTEQDFIEMGIESLGLRQRCTGVTW